MVKGRKLYVAHLLRISWDRMRTRANRITKKKLQTHIERQWICIPEAQRDDVLSYLKSGLVADRDILMTEETAPKARDGARSLPNNNSNEKVARYRAFLQAVEQYRTLSRLSASANRRWQRFSLRLQALPAKAQTQELVDTADDHAGACATKSIKYNDTMEELEKQLEAEVPLDAFQRRKVPRDWIITAHGSSLDVVDANNVKDLLRSENQASNPFKVGTLGADATNWANARLFSTGSSSASLWVRTNGNGKIIDRLVRKDVISPGSWYDVRMWAWMKSDEDNDDAMPWELHCHGAMTENDTSNNIVKLRETDKVRLLQWVDKRYKKWKVYTDFCPNGDLSALIEHYARDIRTHIPEPFILYVAECLFHAGLAMTKVSTAEDGLQIVHRDLKPGNVFLDDLDPNTYPDYPRPLLGDFGFAISTSTEDPRNPRVWAEQQGVCEIDYKPPELVAYAEQDSLDFIAQTEQLLEHTNVWQAGLVLRCLVTQDTPPQAIWLGDGRADTTYSLQGHSAAGYYNKDLIRMIEDCMRYECNRRPTFESLLRRVNQLTGADGGRDLSRGLRTAFDERPTGQDIDLDYGGQDQYAVGMAWPATTAGEDEDDEDDEDEDVQEEKQENQDEEIEVEEDQNQENEDEDEEIEVEEDEEIEVEEDEGEEIQDEEDQDDDDQEEPQHRSIYTGGGAAAFMDFSSPSVRGDRDEELQDADEDDGDDDDEVEVEVDEDANDDGEEEVVNDGQPESDSDDLYA